MPVFTAYEAWQSSLTQVLNDLHSGKLKPTDLHPALLMANVKAYTTAAQKGYGSKILDIDYSTPDAELAEKIRTNLYQFSGAKTYSQLQAYRNMLLDKKGDIVPYNVFAKKINAYRRTAQGIDEQYNKKWLQTEYNMAISQASQAREWQTYMDNKDIYPCIKYHTTGDERVRHSHAELDGIVKKKDDSFWDMHYPKKDWGCRCYTTEVNEKPSDRNPTVQNNPVFSGNVGKDGTVFSQKHPYFPTLKKDFEAILQALKNDYTEYLDYKVVYNGKRGGSVMAHPSVTNKSGYEDNLEAAKYIADKYNKTVTLTKDLENQRNADMAIDGIQWEVKTNKTATKTAIETRLRKGKKQSNYIIVRIKSSITENTFKRALRNVASPKIKEYWIIWNDKRDFKLTYEQIMADGFF